MSEKLNISISPHIKGHATTRGIMLDVVIAMLPALCASIYFFGIRAFYITAICVFASVLGEYLFQVITRRDVSVGDLSAVVTGMLLAFNLPVTIPEWQAVLGSLIAIVVVKQLFGGIGYNFANPALTARIVMLLSFTGTMSNWVEPRNTDVVSSATPLAVLTNPEVEGDVPSLFRLFIGDRAGSLGETCAAAIIIGFLYLVFRRVITWHIPVIFVGSAFAFTFFFCGMDAEIALCHILSGGLLLGAVFMATDYTTSPPTVWGKVIFALGCGILTAAIRIWGSNPEGVSYAILFMNILTPYITKLTRRKVFGARRAA